MRPELLVLKALKVTRVQQAQPELKVLLDSQVRQVLRALQVLKVQSV